MRIGARLYRTRWAVVALAAALTLRHAIAKTGANTLEGYFHPRQLAFALGLLAVALFLERRERVAPALLALAAACASDDGGVVRGLARRRRRGSRGRNGARRWPRRPRAPLAAGGRVARGAVRSARTSRHAWTPTGSR